MSAAPGAGGSRGTPDPDVRQRIAELEERVRPFAPGLVLDILAEGHPGV